MDSLMTKFQQFYESDPELRLVLDTYKEIKQVYLNTQRARGVIDEPRIEIQSSSSITIELKPISSSFENI